MEVVTQKIEGVAQCIVQHPGFDGVCLNVWVLQTAFFSFRQHYGSSSNEGTLHECNDLLTNIVFECFILENIDLLVIVS